MVRAEITRSNMRLNHLMRRQPVSPEEAVERRWGAVLTADVVEYSRLTDLDEEQADFASAEDAARCAFDVQVSMAVRCKGTTRDSRMVFRIGLSWGRIMADDVDIYGHDVNVAARLQTVAPPGGIAMSAEVASRIRQ